LKFRVVLFEAKGIGIIFEFMLKVHLIIYARCTRNCYNCPICTSPLTVSAFELPSDGASSETPSGPFILACGWCNWTSLDIGIKFEKHNNITGQLSRIKNGGKVVVPTKERESQAERLLRRSTSNLGHEAETGADEPPSTEQPDAAAPQDAEEMFSRLTTFYRNQIAESSESGLFGGLGSSDMPFSSPSSISRLLNIYSGKKPKRTRPTPMREALTPNEGLSIFDPSTEDALLAHHRETSWTNTTSFSQRAFQTPLNQDAKSVAHLRPVPSLLRTKRAKRCRACRTLLAKPEPRMTSSRWRIRVLALNNIPRLSLRALSAAPTLGPDLGVPPPADQPVFEYAALQTGHTYQFLLTTVNPLYDPIRVTLASPASTPGRVGSRVTILCPQFEVGANSDVWDSALESASSKRKSVMPGLDASTGNARQAEAGKVWASGRNWTDVIVEVVPGLVPEETDMEEDEDVLEIAVFVRLEYETEGAGGEEKTGTGMKEKREDAFWCVLGVGRIKSVTS
jgi:dynactin 4